MTETAKKLSLIVSIFNECQETPLSHDRLLASLMDLYTKASFCSNFWAIAFKWRLNSRNWCSYLTFYFYSRCHFLISRRTFLNYVVILWSALSVLFSGNGLLILSSAQLFTLVPMPLNARMEIREIFSLSRCFYFVLRCVFSWLIGLIKLFQPSLYILFLIITLKVNIIHSIPPPTCWCWSAVYLFWF